MGCSFSKSLKTWLFASEDCTFGTSIMAATFENAKGVVLACDTRVSWPDRYIDGCHEKIKCIVPNKIYVACSGDNPGFYACDIVIAGMDPSQARIFKIDSDGDAWQNGVIDAGGSFMTSSWYRRHDNRDEALGAIHKDMRIASYIDEHTSLFMLYYVDCKAYKMDVEMAE